MNLIIESPQEIYSSVDTLINESGQKTKDYYLCGVFSTPNQKNRNGRIYSREIWEREVERYQKEINEKSINSLCEYNHPPRSSVDPLKAVGRIVELKLDGNYVMGKIKILNNNSPETNQLKALIDENVKIGVSSRGVGSVDARGIVKDFKLITYDIVPNNSDYNAVLTGISEGVVLKDGMVMNAEYALNESGEIYQKAYTSADAYKVKDAFLNIINKL